MYAIVKTGGKQYKVAVGDVVEVEKLAGDAGATISLPALLVVDGTDVTSDAKALAGVTVTGEVVAQTKGPKLTMMSYKNKTGYKRRMGHRQSLTQVRVTGIDTAKQTKAAAPAADASDSKGAE
ncbi:MAG: ribosomal protein [Frankiales bacterium]|nr:ribosomal protein [Frankiales bacterium]